MKIDHLEKRVNEYKNSIKTVVQKRILWNMEILVLFPALKNSAAFDNDMVELGIYDPNEINEKLIIEKIDEFLKEMIKWEVPLIRTKLGFKTP